MNNTITANGTVLTTNQEVQSFVDGLVFANKKQYQKRITTPQTNVVKAPYVNTVRQSKLVYVSMLHELAKAIQTLRMHETASA